MDEQRSLTVVFETHSSSLDNESARASGWDDVPLSRRGEEQARDLGARRRRNDFAAVFCSDLSRAYRTAEIAFGDRAIPIVRDSRLRECHYGALTGRPLREIEARRTMHVDTPFPDGESYRDVVARVSAWMTDVASEYGDRTVLVIGHRAVFYALEHLLGHAPLEVAIAAPWRWQPGWTYRIMPAR